MGLKSGQRVTIVAYCYFLLKLPGVKANELESQINWWLTILGYKLTYIINPTYLPSILIQGFPTMLVCMIPVVGSFHVLSCLKAIQPDCCGDDADWDSPTSNNGIAKLQAVRLTSPGGVFKKSPLNSSTVSSNKAR